MTAKITFLNLILSAAATWIMSSSAFAQGTSLTESQKSELTLYFKGIYDKELVPAKTMDSRLKKVYTNACKLRYEKEIDMVDSDLLLYNSPLQSALDSLTAELAPHLSSKRKLRVFVTRELSANAYSTGDGNLFVSIGLMAKLHTRDELLFVLAHEISHDQLEHFTKSQEDRAKLMDADFDAELRRASRSDMQRYTKMGVVINSKLSEVNYFSRRYEFEADSLGNQLLLKLGLSHQSAVLTLSELEHIDKESVNPVIDIKQVAHYHMGEVDEEWFQGQTSSLGNMVYKPEEVPDSLRTHPDIKLRIAKFSGVNELAEVPEKVSADYSFIQREAEKECLYSWLIRGDYGRTYYLAERFSAKGASDYASLIASISLSLMSIHSQRHDLGYHLQHEANLYSVPYNMCLRMLNEFTSADFIRMSESYLSKMNKEVKIANEPDDINCTAQYLLCVAKKQTADIAKWEAYYLKHFPDGMISTFIKESKK